MTPRYRGAAQGREAPRGGPGDAGGGVRGPRGKPLPRLVLICELPRLGRRQAARRLQLRRNLGAGRC